MYKVRYLNNNGWGEWESVEEKKMRGRLENYFIDVELCIVAMLNGESIRTPFAEYRQVQLDPENEIENRQAMDL